jgi:[ribosomal protein S18]-alanine N-acetyltransferase
MEETIYTIRDYREEDFPALSNLWELTNLSNKARGDNAESISETLRLRGKLLVMFIDDQLMGTSWISNDGRRLYLHHFGIHPDYQGKGYAHPLVEASLAYARQLNMQIKLEVHRQNLKAVELYKHHGFTYLGDYDVYIKRDPKS